MIWCKLCGGILLVAAGLGAGWCAWRQKWEAWQHMHCFGRLLRYLLDAIRYRALPGAVLLEMAACRPEFTAFRLERCRGFADIPLPTELGAARKPEWADALADLEAAPQQTACRLLAHLIVQCEEEEKRAADAAAQAYRLYLPIGASLGVLAAILLI